MPKEPLAKEQPAGDERTSVSSKMYPRTKKKLRVLAAYHGQYAAECLADLVDDAYAKLADILPGI